MSEARKSAVAYLAAVGLSLTLLAWVLELWWADLSVPFVYGGDALLVQLWVKGTVENGWYLTNGSVGAPFGLAMHDFPLVDSVFFLLLKVLSWGTSDYARVLNLYYLLTFPLAVVSALFVFRRFDVPRGPAVVGGLLFAFLPYHFIRGQEHLFLASYFLVPLAVMMVLRVYLGGENRPRVRLDDPRTLAAGLVCLLVGCGGVYYAFFTCYLLLVSGMSAAVWRKRAYPLGHACMAVALICLVVLGNLAPTLVYRLAHGPNPDAVVRDPAQAEIFGLKLAQLLLPVSGHRVAYLAALKARYDEALSALVNENASSTLGVVAGLGFLALTAGFLMRRPSDSEAPRLRDGLIVLNLAATLLATFGGFGTLFGFLATPWIRGYNRMSIFIAFFALFAVVLALGKLDRLARSRGARFVFLGGLGALLIVGVLDQTAPRFVPRYAEVKRAFESDAEFVRRLEASLPVGAMVFQLPYSPFPEPPMVHQMQWYDHLRGYLHSRSLRWSYAAMRGRYGDLWQAHVADEPAEAMIRRLAAAGFSGIYIDRMGFADGAVALETELARKLAFAPEVSRDERFAFFDLTRYADSLQHTLTPEEWTTQRHEALFPVLASCGRGFFSPEPGADGPRHWSYGAGEITLTNPSPAPRRVELAITIATQAEEPSLVQVKGLGAKTDYPVDGTGRVIRQSLVVPPGVARLKLSSNAQRVKPPGDPRTLVFCVDRLMVSAIRAGAEAGPVADAPRVGVAR